MLYNKSYSSFLFFMILTAFLSACTEEREKSPDVFIPKIYQMTGNVLDDIMQDTKEKEMYLVIDVREPDEYNAAHLYYAINISVRDIEKRIGEIDDVKHKNVVVICRSGNRSGKAAQILAKHGFTKIFNAEGMSTYHYTAVTTVTNVRGAQFQDIAAAGTHSILDAREKNDYEVSHLSGALCADIHNISEMLASLPKGKPCAVYCYTGNRSFAIAQKLAAEGYNVVNSLDGVKEYAGFNLIKP
ncbi:MAG: rhodanese-like domain-containing protein [Treponema sp.]